MTLLNSLEIVIGLFWLGAAGLWFAAAAIRTPEPNALAKPLQRQRKWNRLAALCAGLAAITQFAELVLAHAAVSIGPLQ